MTQPKPNLLTTAAAALASEPHFPHAQWRPVPNYTPGGNHPRLLIVHVMQGSLAGTDDWFRNALSQASAHFGVGRDGTVYQWVLPSDQAWHAMAANDHSIGVEHEGHSGEPLSSDQLAATAAIYAWARQQYPAISAWLNTRPDSGSGLSWHGLGGVAWGNHPQCPGAPIVHQLGELLRLSAGAPGGLQG